jgi:hypothetical protein
MDKKTADFLEMLSNKYRHCDTYQDSGIIQSSMTTGPTVNYKRHCTFNTFYVRPGRLSIHLWSNEDESQLAAWLVYKYGEVHAIREGASIPVLKCDTLSDAISHVTAYRKNTSDFFELAIPALLEKEIRNSCESRDFFDTHCFLLQELNSKFHLQKAVDAILTDIWFRPDLSVHDVEVKYSIPREHLLESYRMARETPWRQEFDKAMREKNPGAYEDVDKTIMQLEESLTDLTSKSRRVYSHVLFDQDIDESVFDVPET